MWLTLQSQNRQTATKAARRDARVAEEARLESVYRSKAYPGFESRSLRKIRTRSAIQGSRDENPRVRNRFSALLRQRIPVSPQET